MPHTHVHVRYSVCTQEPDTHRLTGPHTKSLAYTPIHAALSLTQLMWMRLRRGRSVRHGIRGTTRLREGQKTKHRARRLTMRENGFWKQINEVLQRKYFLFPKMIMTSWVKLTAWAVFQADLKTVEKRNVHAWFVQLISTSSSSSEKRLYKGWISFPWIGKANLLHEN